MWADPDWSGLMEAESLDNFCERKKRVGGKLYNMTIMQ